MPDEPRALAIARTASPPEASERAQREQERSRSVARRRRGRAGGILTFVVALVGAVWVGWFSPVFALDDAALEVTGVDQPGVTVDAQDVHRALAAFVGTPLPRLDLGAMGEAVSQVDGVRSATVSRAWPDGVTVAVDARVPVAAIPGPGDAYTLVDSEAVVVGSPVADPGVLPVVDVPSGSENVRVLDAVIAVLAALPTDLAQRVATIGAETEDTIRMTLGDGTVVVWGGAEETKLKAQVTLTMLASGAVHAAVIDVSAPTLPVTHN